MGKYVVSAPNGISVTISNGYDSANFKNGTFIYDDGLAKSFPSIFLPVEESFMDEVIEPFIDAKDTIVEVAKDTVEFAKELGSDIAEAAVEIKDEIVEMAVDIKESAKKSYSKKDKKIVE